MNSTSKLTKHLFSATFKISGLLLLRNNKAAECPSFPVHSLIRSPGNNQNFYAHYVDYKAQTSTLHQ